MKPIAESLDAIRGSIHEANKALIEREQYKDAHQERGEHDQLIEYYVERAFTQLLVLLETRNLEHSRNAVEHLQAEAKGKYAETFWADDMYLVWTEKLSIYIDALEAALGEGSGRTITKDVTEILRATQYAITDRACFPEPPGNEDDVHHRIEAVLRCLFPDGVRHKPSISKPVKNFQPDTGLPALRTLIEYKFIGDDADAKRVSDEILADTRGYFSKEWDNYLYVVYETYRVRPEAEWNALMRTCGVGENTHVVVVSGEPPATPRPRPKRKPTP